MLWLPRFCTKAITQPSRKHIKNQNKINSYKFLKPFLVPREDVGGHKQKVERSDCRSLCVGVCVCICVCVFECVCALR